ncbi:hypothetical protein KBA41_06685 [Candidatus Ozemobacteraceae bacterium]|nr:hypothetical protein [Candidatus Ozemobacteraceae bacterium]
MKRIRIFGCSLLLSLSLCLCAAPESRAEPPVDGAVNLGGDLMFRGDQYDVDGDAARAPYPYTGIHRYLDFNFELYRKASAFENWNLRFGGVQNNSRYRSRDWGTELERFRFVWEKGDRGTPFRLEAGEIYGNFTNRTLQRALHGFLLDLQPVLKGDVKRSIQFLWGLARGEWKDPFEDRDQSMGISLVEERRDDLRFSLNWVTNRRDATATRPGLLQQVWSGAFEKTLDRERRHVLESEYAWFSGDHEGDGTPGSGLDRYDTGLFMQLRHHSNPFGYTWRFEEYGKDFRPNGANITQNRKALEGYLSWQLEKIRTLSVRLQRFRSAWESPNPLDSDIAGVTLSGQVSPKDKLYASLNAYIDRSDDRLDTVDSRSRNLDLNLSRPLRNDLNARFGFGYRDFDNRLGPAGDNRALQALLGLDKSIEWKSAPLTIGLNFIRNTIDSSGIFSNDWNTGLTLYRTAGNQEFGLTWNTQALDYRPRPNADVYANDFGFRWQRRNGDIVMGVEIARNRRDETRAWRYGFYLGTEFDRALTRAPKKETAGEAVAGDVSERFDLAAIVPGTEVASFVVALDRRGIAMTKTGNLFSADHPVFEDLFQRQTLAAEADDAGNIVRAGAVVRLEEYATPSDIMDAYDRIRRRLLDRLGNPVNSYERGAVGPALADEIRSGAFVRVLDWKTPHGLLRLGFPRRLDGRIRLEVQIAREFPRETEGMWGFDSLN